MLQPFAIRVDVTSCVVRSHNLSHDRECVFMHTVRTGRRLLAVCARARKLTVVDRQAVAARLEAEEAARRVTFPCTPRAIPTGLLAAILQLAALLSCGRHWGVIERVTVHTPQHPFEFVS